MQINITYDSSVASAPAGYKAAINAAVKFFDETFNAPITVNITVGWGEVDGQALPLGSVGGSSTTFLDQAITAEQFWEFQNPQLAQPGLNTANENSLTSGFGGRGVYGYGYVPSAEAQAIGFASANPSTPDGYIALNSSIAYAFNPNDRAVAGKYDAIGLLEGEIAQVLGVVSFGEVNAPPPYDLPLYTPLDLFRYLSPGVHDYSPANSYFSLNGEQMLLPFNNSGEGNPAGWASSVTGDALDAFAQPGVELNFSTVDIRLMQVLGYEVSDVAPTPNGTPTKPLVVAKTQGNASGHALSYDGPYAILLDDNVTYTNHGSIVASGTRSQIDVVGVTENAGDSDPSNSVFSNATGATLSVTATAVAADAAGYYGYDSINNSGHIQVVSDQADAWGVFSNTFQNSGLVQVTSDQSNATGVASNTFTNTGTATLTVQAENDAVGCSGSSATNAGKIEISGFNAIGVESNTFTNSETGTVIVQAENNATGVNLNDQPFTNAGTIEVSGLNAIAVDNGVTSLVNSGTIEATNVGQGGTSTAVFVDALPGSTLDDANSGLIQGQIAVNLGGFPAGAYTFDNTGTIDGIFEAFTGSLTIDNTGTINGAIELNNGNYVYNGVGGNLTGGIFLDYGTNAVTLGNDGEAVAGGGDADAMTGGDGNDFFEIFGGNNTINGGGGFNALSFADAAMAVAINLATGTANVDGTSTVENIQEVIGGTYGDTMIAGSSAVTFIAGSGKDTLTGGAGNDTLVAGAGGDTMTGSGGNNTFIYSAGDNQLVVTDFGTAGDKNVLDIDGYTTAQTIIQQGANTLITLSATDSILLDNVTASSLTAGEIVYNASPYQPPSVPISVPIYGTTTITFTSNLTIPLGEYIKEANQGVGFYDDPGALGDAGTLTNYGSIIVSQASGDVTAVSSQGSAFDADFANEAGATFAVTDTDPNGTAYGLNYPGAVITNAGAFSVTAAGDAFGIDSSVNRGSVDNESTGVLTVTSTTGTATGVYLVDGNVDYPFTNDGVIDVTGATAAYGVGTAPITGGVNKFFNNGAIDVTGTNASSETFGIQADPDSDITNTGTITAQVAIDCFGFQDGGRATFSVVNSGTINGDVDLVYSDSTVQNSGAIHGNVNFGDGDCVFNGTGGTVSGVITLGYGKNTVTLGNGNEAVVGGGYEDTITGGTGNNFFEIGHGDNVITGGGGTNTLSLADSDVSVTVDLATGTVVGAGTSTISNIQVVIGSTFNDTLIGGSSACTLIAGSGHDKLEAGTGNTVLVAGTGGDTMTGGSGDDTFIYSAGDEHLVISNFSAQDVLDIDGYSKALSITQQGANALITLASGANIILDNVEASSLNSSNLVFNTNPWTPPATPASPPIFFSSGGPIIQDNAFTDPLTIYAPETVNIAATASFNSGIASRQQVIYLAQPLPLLDNYGTINITSQYDQLDAISCESQTGVPSITNYSHATISITDIVGSAIGFDLDSVNDYDAGLVRNAGTVDVTALTSAVGVLFTPFTNTHVFDVTSSTADATGVEFSNYVTNSGTIDVSGVTSAVAIDNILSAIPSNAGFWEGSYANTGTITATATGVGAQSIAFEIAGKEGDGISTNGELAITNSGTITAQIAIDNIDQYVVQEEGYDALNVWNSGTINGAMDMGGGYCQITNLGTINGAISFQAILYTLTGNGFYQPAITNSGTINGNISLNGSDCTVTNTGQIVSTDIDLGTDSTFISTSGSVVIGSGLTAATGTIGIGTGGTLNGAGTVEANLDIISGATVQASGGTLAIAGSIGGSGEMSIANGAALSVSGSDTATALFEGAAGTLTIGTPAHFAGAIAGLHAGDVVDLLGIQAVSAPVSGGVLTVTDSHGNIYTFDVSGNLAGNSFTIDNTASGAELIFGSPANHNAAGSGIAVDPSPNEWPWLSWLFGRDAAHAPTEDSAISATAASSTAHLEASSANHVVSILDDLFNWTFAIHQNSLLS